MANTTDNVKLIQSVLNLFLGKGEILFQEKENTWIDSLDNSHISDEEVYTLAIKLIEDASQEIESNVDKPFTNTPIYRLSCGCCPICGCTCTESELEEIKRRLS